jgi:hypothetical protein
MLVDSWVASNCLCQERNREARSAFNWALLRCSSTIRHFTQPALVRVTWFRHATAAERFCVMREDASLTQQRSAVATGATCEDWVTCTQSRMRPYTVPGSSPASKKIDGRIDSSKSNKTVAHSETNAQFCVCLWNAL